MAAAAAAATGRPFGGAAEGPAVGLRVQRCRRRAAMPSEWSFGAVGRLRAARGPRRVSCAEAAGEPAAAQSCCCDVYVATLPLDVPLGPATWTMTLGAAVLPQLLEHFVTILCTPENEVHLC
eukprot:SM000373S13603  [mRNA]  locus=s373:73517:73882:+ [translate_table: standard]